MYKNKDSKHQQYKNLYSKNIFKIVLETRVPSTRPYHGSHPSPHASDDIIDHVLKQIVPNFNQSSCYLLDGGMDLNRLPNISQTCSIGLMFEEHAGHAIVLFPTTFKKSETQRAL